jgi:hypothetical protein
MKENDPSPAAENVASKYSDEKITGNLPWRKSSYSSSGGCVEAAAAADQILIRDSKNRNGSILRFDLFEWESFLAGVRDGEFDVLQLRSRRSQD